MDVNFPGVIGLFFPLFFLCAPEGRSIVYVFFFFHCFVCVLESKSSHHKPKDIHVYQRVTFRSGFDMVFNGSVATILKTNPYHVCSTVGRRGPTSLWIKASNSAEISGNPSSVRTIFLNHLNCA